MQTIDKRAKPKYHAAIEELFSEEERELLFKKCVYYQEQEIIEYMLFLNGNPNSGKLKAEIRIENGELSINDLRPENWPEYIKNLTKDVFMEQLKDGEPSELKVVECE